MLITYGRAGENARVAERLYAERFPERRHPSWRTILRCVQRSQETGFLLPNRERPGRRRVHLHVRVEERILREFERNPGNSVRRVAAAHGTQFIEHCGRMDCTRIIINGCNSFFPEMQNSASGFVKVFSLFLFKICNILCVLIICKMYPSRN